MESSEQVLAECFTFKRESTRYQGWTASAERTLRREAVKELHSRPIVLLGALAPWSGD